MAVRPFLILSLLLYSITTTIALSLSPTPSPSAPSPFPSPPSSSSSNNNPLDPEQIAALHSLNILTTTSSKSPCSLHTPTTTTSCDSSSPFRNLISLHLSNCTSTSPHLSPTALKSLSTITDLQFINCPKTPLIHFPSSLSLNLQSFTAINSLHKLTGVWLSRLRTLTHLTISNVPISASGPSIILSPMKNLQSLTISHSNLTGSLPKHWHSNLTHIDLSNNTLKGIIHTSLTRLESLQSLDLSSNSLVGEIPDSIGDLLSLQNLSLASNSLSGSVPDSISAIPGLVHLDLGSNRLNGTIPKFIAEIEGLKYLNLEKNNFHGVMPFNASFLKKLVVFKVGENSDLCYNHSTISSKLKLGIAPCDKHGLPLSPPPAKDTSGDGESSGESSDDDYSSGDEVNQKGEHHHGPSKVVLGSSLEMLWMKLIFVLLIIFSFFGI